MYQTPRLTLLTPSSPVDQEEAIDTAERRVISQMKRFAPDSGEQFEEWLMYVNSLFALENISPVKRLRILRTFVCQAHRVVIDSNGQNYEAAIEALLIYESMGGNDPTGALLELNFAKQDQGESILEFYYRVERLVAIAYPFARYSLEERQSQALQRLVVGLRPGKVATLLTERFVSGTLALEDALEVCRQELKVAEHNKLRERLHGLGKSSDRRDQEGWRPRGNNPWRGHNERFSDGFYQNNMGQTKQPNNERFYHGNVGQMNERNNAGFYQRPEHQSRDGSWRQSQLPGAGTPGMMNNNAVTNTGGNVAPRGTIRTGYNGQSSGAQQAHYHVGNVGASATMCNNVVNNTGGHVASGAPVPVNNKPPNDSKNKVMSGGVPYPHYNVGHVFPREENPGTSNDATVGTQSGDVRVTDADFQ